MVDGSGKDLISRINKPEKPQNQKVITGKLAYRALARNLRKIHCHESI